MDGNVQPTQPPLLVLPGALGVADGGGRALELLGRGRRVVGFAYGRERSLDAVLGRALAAAGAERFDVIGFSVGGWLAQCLAAREPGRVRRMVLAHSFALDPADAWRFALAIRLWPLLPRALFGAAVSRKARLALRALAAKDPARCTALLEEVRAALADLATAGMLEAQQHVLLDSLRSGSCAADCPVLIVEGEDDPILPPGARAILTGRYPGAERVVLSSVGHAAALVEPELFAARVDAFLRR